MTKPALRAAFGKLEKVQEKIRSKRPVTDTRRAQGIDTFRQIITAAREIYIAEGHAGLSIGKVATQCDINKGNIAYYFPTKDLLLRALLLEELDRYISLHLRQQREDTTAALDVLMLSIDEYFDEMPEQAPLFLQTWVYVLSDENVRALFAEIYSVIIDFIAALVRASRPKLSASNAKFMAFQIMIIVEGRNGRVWNKTGFNQNNQ